jgi:hypothetical protein
VPKSFFHPIGLGIVKATNKYQEEVRTSTKMNVKIKSRQMDEKKKFGKEGQSEQEDDKDDASAQVCSNAKLYG